LYEHLERPRLLDALVIVGCDCKTDGDTGKGQREVRTLPVRTRCSERQVYGCVGTSENLIVPAI